MVVDEYTCSIHSRWTAPGPAQTTAVPAASGPRHGHYVTAGPGQTRRGQRNLALGRSDDGHQCLPAWGSHRLSSSLTKWLQTRIYGELHCIPCWLSWHGSAYRITGNKASNCALLTFCVLWGSPSQRANIMQLWCYFYFVISPIALTMERGVIWDAIKCCRNAHWSWSDHVLECLQRIGGAVFWERGKSLEHSDNSADDTEYTSMLNVNHLLGWYFLRRIKLPIIPQTSNVGGVKLSHKEHGNIHCTLSLQWLLMPSKHSS